MPPVVDLGGSPYTPPRLADFPTHVFSTGTAVDAPNSGGLIFTAPEADGAFDCQLLLQPKPSGTWRRYLKFTVGPSARAYLAAGFVARETATGKFWSGPIVSWPNGLYLHSWVFSNPTTRTADVKYDSLMSWPMHLAYEDDGANFNVYGSESGLSTTYELLASYSSTNPFTTAYDKVGLFVCAYNQLFSGLPMLSVFQHYSAAPPGGGA